MGRSVRPLQLASAAVRHRRTHALPPDRHSGRSTAPRWPSRITFALPTPLTLRGQRLRARACSRRFTPLTTPQSWSDFALQASLWLARPTWTNLAWGLSAPTLPSRPLSCREMMATARSSRAGAPLEALLRLRLEQLGSRLDPTRAARSDFPPPSLESSASSPRMAAFLAMGSSLMPARSTPSGSCLPPFLTRSGHWTCWPARTTATRRAYKKSGNLWPPRAPRLRTAWAAASALESRWSFAPRSSRKRLWTPGNAPRRSGPAPLTARLCRSACLPSGMPCPRITSLLAPKQAPTWLATTEWSLATAHPLPWNPCEKSTPPHVLRGLGRR
mmetsp:Transcript_21188/g.67491  ORF Transcript_21188/g.67491 Transcript_21188/m.67491 type:complete len:330 (+) Transcript_21188:103-1092(+)